MAIVSRNLLLQYTGFAMAFAAAGCAAPRAETPRAQQQPLPHVYGYHPFENGIPAKGHSMTYLIKGTGGSVLVDPGRGTAHNEIIAFIHSHKLEPAQVKWALLTHCHVDHTGGARPIQAAGIPVAASAFTAKAIREASVDMGFKNGPQPESSCTVDRILNDGDVLEVGEMRIRTVAIPGHTAGCLAFFVETDEGLTAFTGDILRNTGQPGWTGSPSFSLEESLSSIEKLIALAPDKAYWGHGEVEEPATQWLQRCLDMYRNGRWVMD
jgi:glyoxylase-like metal-dependent hydrolase (beta-lactamase superfamily II)